MFTEWNRYSCCLTLYSDESTICEIKIFKTKITANFSLLAFNNDR